MNIFSLFLSCYVIANIVKQSSDKQSIIFPSGLFHPVRNDVNAVLSACLILNHTQVHIN